MKILSIGNSFSEDSHKYLHDIAFANGVDLECVNLFIGGCSLERHYNNIINDTADYDLQINGHPGERKISISEAFKIRSWDIITLQQVSGYSGVPQSYLPYLPLIAEYVRKNCAGAKIYFHQTWSYEKDSAHPDFSIYSCRQDEMHRRIVDSSLLASKLISAEIIPTGEVINALRTKIPEFDYERNGLSLCRDGFHLSLDYGRFAAAATWFYKLTKCKIDTAAFENFDQSLLGKIADTVMDTVK